MKVRLRTVDDQYVLSEGEQYSLIDGAEKATVFDDTSSDWPWKLVQAELKLAATLHVEKV